MGANRGDSIENFIGINKQGDGGNIRNKIPSERINQKWSIYGIEGNSKFDKNLLDIKEKYSSDQYNIIIYNSTIVTTYDGKIKFYLDKNDRFGNNVGSSIKENHPDVILSKKVYEEKPCVDFARLLREYNENDFIIVKMDIEGAEFDLLLHLIAQNVLKLIDVFAVEYHMYLSPFKEPKDVFSQIFKKLNVSELYWS